jgi:ATP synthase protein I
MRVGVELVSAVIVGLAIGWGLDAWLKTRPLFLILFVFLGGAAGIVNVWRLVAPSSGTSGPGAAKKPPG